MKYTIKKGNHRAWPLRFGLWFGKTIIRRSVTFYPSCKYDLKTDDQHDTHKLFGIGYFPHHQKNSARFGWRYNNLTNKIIISAYCYVDGERVIKDIVGLNINERYIFTLEVNPHFYEFGVKPIDIMHSVIVEFVDKKINHWISYPLSVFFGGNRTAPNDMMIEINKI